MIPDAKASEAPSVALGIISISLSCRAVFRWSRRLHTARAGVGRCKIMDISARMCHYPGVGTYILSTVPATRCVTIARLSLKMFENKLVAHVYTVPFHVQI